MLDTLKFIEVVVSILLIFVILIQNKNVSLNLSSMSWWMGSVTKRWPEKIIHNTTVILWILFVVNSLLLFLLSK